VKLQGGVVERAMVEWRIVVTLVVVLVAIGLRALLVMPRQEFPEFTVRQGLVISRAGSSIRSAAKSPVGPTANDLHHRGAGGADAISEERAAIRRSSGDANAGSQG
jgi:hypothetical protein